MVIFIPILQLKNNNNKKPTEVREKSSNLPKVPTTSKWLSLDENITYPDHPTK